MTNDPEAATGPQQIAQDLRLVRAPNPSPMTHSGTNTWIVGTGEVAVIDPGPDDARHLSAILAALSPGEAIRAILVTHAHRDHSPLAAALSQHTGAPVSAAGNMAGRRRPIMAALATSGLVGGGEGVDAAFAPDHVLEDGAVVTGPGWQLEVIATPGHTADHLAFAWGAAVFTGDHVMGWASSLVSPPDGDLVTFMNSCARLKARSDQIYYPGHGAPVGNPQDRLGWLIEHRKERTRQILATLAAGPETAAGLTRKIYTDVPPGLLKAAERNVLAHLVALSEDMCVAPEGPLSATARFELSDAENSRGPSGRPETPLL